MNQLRRPLLPVVLFVSALAACGGSDDPSADEDVGADVDTGGGDIGGSDVGDDVAPDTGEDTAPDVGVDTTPDAEPDTAADTGVDTDPDAGVDTGPDSGPDTGVDTGPDTGVDTGVDTGPDTGADTGADTAPDIGTDTDAGSSDGVIDWCRLQFPTTIEGYPGDMVTVYGRVFESGITDRTSGVDADAALVAEVGWGPAGIDPTGDVGWAWFAATPNVGWADDDEPGNDEYQGELTVPAPGSYDFAFRFSADSGATWTYCDRRAGGDGSDDGYDPADAGDMTSFDVCEPNPCGEPPAPVCADAATVLVSSGPALCEGDGPTPVCTFAEELVPCDDGSACADGACVALPRAPGPGELVITEVMPQSRSGSDPGEWFEVYNATTDTLDLIDCTIGEDDAPQDTVDVALSLAPGAYAVFAANADTAVNGGVPADFDWGGFGLTNTGDVIVIACAGEVVDRVEYTADEVVLGQALQVDIVNYSTEDNDDLANWCFAEASYADGLLGTPGADNRSCALPEYSIDWCRLQFPLDLTTTAGADSTWYGRVYIAGLTDATASNDPADNVIGEVGYGPDGVEPSDMSWVWFTGEPNAEYGGEEAANDEYVAVLTAPAASETPYDVAFRFSGDGGVSWTYCDRPAGPGADGAENGYHVADAGSLIVEVAPDPCDPNPCTTPDTAATCLDATTASIPVVPGACEVVEGAASCTYDVTTEDCSLDGGVCVDGGCITLAPLPGMGDVIITEVMAQSRAGADPGEWFELYNVTDTAFDLLGCTLGELDAPDQHTIETSLPIDFGSYRVMIADANPDVNGGIVDGYDFGSFGLRNSGDSIVLTCGGVVVDSFEYGSADVTVGVALQRGTDAFGPDATIDDWCPATDTYGTSSWFGTPGGPNRSCNVPPVDVTWCRLQFPLSVSTYESNEVTVYGHVYVEGLTDISPAVDRYPALIAQAGYGADGSTPPSDWTWIEAFPNEAWNDASSPNNDEYEATFQAPAADGSPYDYAWRFSGDGGETWLYCDRNAGTGSDGAEDGYQPENAGSLAVVANPCTPNPCTEPPAATCENATTRLVSSGPGLCSIVDDAPTCAWTESTVPCDAGQVCADGACVEAPTWDIGWCVLQFPDRAAGTPGSTTEVYGQVYAEGLTDQTTGNDVSPSLVGQLGWGPVAADPSSDPGAWIWLDGEPNPGWNDSSAPNNDEYQATLTLPPPIDGEQAYAWRFSGDGGATWSYCDLAPGLSDGFSVLDAGEIFLFLP